MALVAVGLCGCASAGHLHFGQVADGNARIDTSKNRQWATLPDCGLEVRIEESEMLMRVGRGGYVVPVMQGPLELELVNNGSRPIRLDKDSLRLAQLANSAPAPAWPPDYASRSEDLAPGPSLGPGQSMTVFFAELVKFTPTHLYVSCTVDGRPCAATLKLSTEFSLEPLYAPSRYRHRHRYDRGYEYPYPYPYEYPYPNGF